MGSTLSIGGRLIKIDACLSNIDVYQMSMRLLHKTNIENISRPIGTFFWAGAADKKNTTLSNGDGFANPGVRVALE
jgi:hypothetical protein